MVNLTLTRLNQLNSLFAISLALPKEMTLIKLGSFCSQDHAPCKHIHPLIMLYNSIFKKPTTNLRCGDRQTADIQMHRNPQCIAGHWRMGNLYQRWCLFLQFSRGAWKLCHVLVPRLAGHQDACIKNPNWGAQEIVNVYTVPDFSMNNADID